MFSLSQETIKTMKGMIPMKGITLGNYFESLMTNSMSSNTMNGTDALVWVASTALPQFEDLEALTYDSAWNIQEQLGKYRLWENKKIQKKYRSKC